MVPWPVPVLCGQSSAQPYAVIHSFEDILSRDTFISGKSPIFIIVLTNLSSYVLLERFILKAGGSIKISDLQAICVEMIFRVWKES